MKTSFYVGVHTGQNYNPAEYTEKAGVLLNLAMDVLNSEEHMTTIVKGTLEKSHTEAEVCLEQYDKEYEKEQYDESGWELVLKAVIDLEGPNKLQLDKGKLSNLLRTHEGNEWGQSLKIEKKAVPKEAVVKTPDTED
jgi:hypothetical protein